MKPTKGDLYNFLKGIADGNYGEVDVIVNHTIYDMLDLMAGRKTNNTVTSLLKLAAKRRKQEYKDQVYSESISGDWA